MIQIKINSDSKVIAIYYLDDKKMEGWTEIESIPEPEQIENKVPIMYYRNGVIEYEYEDIPEVPEIEVPQVDKIELLRITTEEKVKTMFFTSTIPTMINTFGLSNNEVLSVKSMFPEWKEDIGEIKQGDDYQCDGDLWQCLQTHTAQANWKPSLNTASIWKRVEYEHDGTIEDPIPYAPPMEIFLGKYYIQNDIKYKCIRDSGQPLTHDLSALVGTYVELV